MFNLTPWKRKEKNGNPQYPLARMRDEFESLFDRFFGQWPMQEMGRENFWALDVDDRENEYVLRAEAPGFEPDEFDIHLSGNVLTIVAEHKVQDKGKREGFEFLERHVGRFQRVLTLPTEVDAEKIAAQYKNGVLLVTLPKNAGAKPRQIKVNE
ncbi:MAG: Hsp20/alpha crystallin family protein [Gemmataceae bacterium]